MYSFYCNNRKEERLKTKTSISLKKLTKTQPNQPNKQQMKLKEKETKIKGKINEIGK